jgi:predicted phosphodiesterase
VHGSPKSVNQYLYPDTKLEEFANIEYDIILMGHTHRPFLRNEYDKTFLNVGSVGLPRDVGNLGCFVVLNTLYHTFDTIRFNFNQKKLIENNINIHSKTIACLNRTQENFIGKLMNF